MSDPLASDRPLRALIYNRVSSDPTGRAISVTRQSDENRAYCRRQGWTVERVITDNDVSASKWATKDRPGYSQVRAELATGRYDALVCWESSRANRGLEGYLELRSLCERFAVLLAYGGRMFDLTRSDDRFSTGMDALLAEREAHVVQERVQAGVDHAARNGRVHGGVPFGYVRHRDPRTGAPGEQVECPTTAPVVREIAARIIGGDTLHRIAAELNGRGVPTPQAWKAEQTGIEYAGGRWTSSKIRALFRNPTVIGMRVHRRGRARHAEVTEGVWPGIVPVTDYQQVVQILADPGRAVHHRGVQPRYLLSGVAQCGPCGAWLRAQTVRGLASYVCAGHGPGTGKGHVSRSRPALDAFVVTHAIARLAEPRLAAALSRRNADVATAVGAARRELSEAEAALEQWREGARTRQVSVASFAAIEPGLLADVEAARRQVAASYARSHPVLAEAVGPDAAQRWRAHADDVVWQRQVVRALFWVVVHRSGRPRGVRGFDPGPVQVIPR